MLTVIISASDGASPAGGVSPVMRRKLLKLPMPRRRLANAASRSGSTSRMAMIVSPALTFRENVSESRAGLTTPLTHPLAGRGVAWPEFSRAHAVGDLGAMWMWNASDDLWVADPGAPIGFEGNLMDVAFDPADPDRGYAVGRNGVLLGYGKSWDP